MDAAGPPLELLTRRLAECPADFLAEPRMGSTGLVPVAAVAGDVLSVLGCVFSEQDLAVFQQTNTGKYRNWLRAVLIGCWLLSNEWFQGKPDFCPAAYAFLTQTLNEMAALTAAPQFVLDADRREELARMCLKDLGLRPAGETVAQAQDRLTTLSAAERQRVIRAARVAEERARSVRAAMAKKAADEAALKAARE